MRQVSYYYPQTVRRAEEVSNFTMLLRRLAEHHPVLFCAMAIAVFPIGLLAALGVCTVAVAWPLAMLLGLL